MIEYIIVGDTAEHKNCLVALCGTDLEHAKEVLHRMLTNPTENDKHLMERHTNFRIESVGEKKQWWHDPFLMSD